MVKGVPTLKDLKGVYFTEAELKALREELSVEADKAKVALKALREEKEGVEKSAKEATEKASGLETQVNKLLSSTT